MTIPTERRLLADGRSATSPRICRRPIVPIDPPFPGGSGMLPTGRDDARPVGVADQHVVVFGQEAGRSGRVGVRSGSVRQVEQLATAGHRRNEVSLGRELVIACRGGSRPTSSDVGDARRSERGEIPDDPVARIRPDVRRAGRATVP